MQNATYNEWLSSCCYSQILVFSSEGFLYIFILIPLDPGTIPGFPKSCTRKPTCMSNDFMIVVDSAFKISGPLQIE